MARAETRHFVDASKERRLCRDSAALCGSAVGQFPSIRMSPARSSAFIRAMR